MNWRRIQKVRFLLLLASAWAATLSGAGPCLAESRIALVIGNSDYGPTIGRLPNPENDAKLLSDALNAVGFEVETVVNADLATMKRSISRFGQRLVKGGPETVGLFFYAGHGVQIGGVNYLIPIRAPIEAEADVEMEAVDAEWVLRQMEFAGNRINIVVLDACRNNPLARNLRSVTAGLARMDAPRGSFIAYSTAPGEAAEDGSGMNSPYTKALAEEIGGQPVQIEELFRNVRVKVMAETEDRQVPWDSSSLTGPFYFKPGQGGEAATAEAAGSKTESKQPETDQPEASPQASRSGQQKDCPDCPELAIIPAGRFEMGSPAEEDGHQDDEGPVHKVAIAKPFALMTREITRGEFAAFVSETGRDMRDGCYLADGGDGKMDSSADWMHPGFAQADDHPAVCVSWLDAKDYAEWLSDKTGHAYRLPSEAEWEYAARAGRKSPWPWSDDDFKTGCKLANAFDQSAKATYPINEPMPCSDGFVNTAPVGSFPANRFGLYDMTGNVWEWTADCYHANYRGAPKDGSAWGPKQCHEYVTRGGAWIENPWDQRFARRYPVLPDGRENGVGFRLARDIQ